jgi:hypothetical protein
MVESLHASFEGKPRLVPEAFAYHTANIRPSVAAEALGKMGSENFIKRLEMSPRFDVLVAAAPRGNRSEVIKEAIDLLDDLATKRNEAAHGSVLNVLANSALAPYVDASEAFGLALCDELTLLSIRNGAARGMDLGAPIKVVDNRIVCITWPASTIRRGDYLLANTSDSSEPCRAGEILEIQVNNVPTDSVTAPPAVDIGLRVGFHTKQNHQFVHVPRKFVL